MKISKIFNDFRAAIKDPDRELAERVFLILAMVAEASLLLALAGDFAYRGDLKEIIVLIGTIFYVLIVTIICFYKNRLTFAIRSIALGLVLIVVPANFFWSGGLEGSGIIWVVFTFLYVGLVVTGAWRHLVLSLLVAVTALCYALSYFYPNLVISRTRDAFYLDSFISTLLTGALCFFMTWAQHRLFKEENSRAQKAAERAEELNRSQNRFFSSMSHEIRTPINSILGLNELILRDEKASDEVVRDATGIQGAGKLLLALINDILDFSKMEAGSMDIVPVDYRVGDLISEIVNMIWLKAHDKGLKFEVSIDPKVPSVLFGDEVRIKQIIINLLNNAVKYTQEGSIDLHIESEQYDQKTTTLSISISDTGMGIKKEAIPYLFDAFKRVDEENNRHIEGTGLGLSIVRQLTELMGGTVTVNSVYGEGSTFTVTLKQGITDSEQIGELNIHNQQTAQRKQYESFFKAPEASILIVDDNEMNLEVERKLLTATEVNIDTAISGQIALEMALRKHYDCVLMDHLMPVMDGIQCLEAMRNQTGGLNRTTPVVVLTANAGSENRDLYYRSGFDGYLVKPVSGESLEDTLMKHIPKEKLIITSKLMRMREDINTTAGYARKAPVIITSTSMCDLPDSIIKKNNIPIIPFLIHTDEGVFKDGVQMEANELIRYINSGKNAVSSPPDVKAYTDFFANSLKKAHHLIHISLTTGMSEDYNIAMEAAKSFDNVTVINSECISSATGILVLIAYKLAQQNIPVEEIVAELEAVKTRLRCSFIIDTTEFMAKKGLVSKRGNRIARALNIHTSLRVKNDKSGVGGAWMGSSKRAYKKYIHQAFPVDIIPDSDVVFITFADVPTTTLEWIKQEISKIAYFEHVVFKQASAAISSNCGPGTFGILYFIKSNKSYNIGSFFEEEKALDDEEKAATPAIITRVKNEELQEYLNQTEKAVDTDLSGEKKWYQKVDCIDGDLAIKNSGSEDALRDVMKIFFDSIGPKTREIEGFYGAEDWKNYTIKVHALKSSAKLIGAMEIAEMAQSLENAGKENNVGYIRENHAAFMEEYKVLGEKLAEVIKEIVGTPDETEKDRPLADESLMKSVFEELHAAAENMDCDTLSEIIKEMEEYKIPDSDKEKFEAVCQRAGNYDYDGILEILDK